MMGEIRLELWQCLAELIDNPVDAFLKASRNGSPLEDPEVRISLPTSDTPTARITVRDNGPGMDLATLNLAVRAGWTSNNSNDNLGLFGMGFNIATARLANHTRILSARAGDAEWTGVEIDFDKMRQQAHFQAPVVTAPKSDPTEHGTIIEISNIKPEQRQAIAKPTTLATVKKRLGRVYSSMLQPNGKPVRFNLFINGQIVKPIRHCVWGEERFVQTQRFGPVHAYIPLNFPLAPRKFCAHHLEWLPAAMDNCPTCNSDSHVQERARRVTGWIGIQRYLSETEYGIDILRNGRKIEVDNRDFFVWDNEGVMEAEYPIDDIGRPKGRIVGEIHLDHGHVNYTKDRFDRNDPSWTEMFELVHGRGPLRPEKAKDAGFPNNTSPLSMLFSTFRRSTPKPVVAGSWAKLLVVKSNDLAREYATKFQQGDAEYETDERWYKLVLEQDEQLLTGAGGAAGPVPPPAPPSGGAFPTPNGTPAAPAGPAAPVPAPAPPRTEILSLSRKFEDDHSKRSFNVKAYSAQPTDPDLSGRAWATKSNASGDHLFYFDLTHEIYQSVTFTPLDALLAELASKAFDSQRTNPEASFAASLTALRSKYATEYELNEQTLVSEANRVLNDIAGSLAKNLGQADARSMFNELPQAQQEAIHQKMLASRVQDPLELMSNGRFLEFAKRSYIVTFVSEHPELFFDGKYWDVRYANLDYGSPTMIDAAKAEVIKTYAGWLEDAAWLSETEGGALISPNRDRLLRASMSLRLLSESIATTEDV
jgi:hypothetical protein